MLFYLGEVLQQYWGPFRLLQSHLFLLGLGTLLSWALSWRLLPILSVHLPRDRGRAFAVQSEHAVGKPTGAGFIFILIFLFVSLLVTPLSWQVVLILGCVILSMLFGYLDDRSQLAWSEYKKGALDLLLAVVGASIICGFQDFAIWLPFTKTVFMVPPILFIPLAALLIWVTINTTNCTDGVDGLSGTLSALALISLGATLYFVVGHHIISEYLLLPHYPNGAVWGIISFTMVGCLAGYLWYNAHPSSMLMGDAGSRALGFLLGILVIVTGNPVLIFVVAGVLLVNGGTGLLKVALLRFFKIGIFHNIRFPLHDHYRHNSNWSNTQVLIRFTVLQAMMTLLLMGLLIKIR